MALEAYAEGSRQSGIMAPIAASLRADLVRNIAEYYAALPAPRRAARNEAAARGSEIAARGIPAQRVPPCSECHGPAKTRRNPAYPSLSGQVPEYLVLQLRLFADDRRGGSPYAHIMRLVAGNLRPDQMRDVAAYYASVPTRSP